MTTFAIPVSTLEATAPTDAMELHCDQEYDREDGDIAFEFDSNPQEDADILLYDAVSDAELDLHTTLPDQDDFMADKDDLIEEDEIDYGDEEVVDAGQSSHTSPIVTHQTPIDDDGDLIDYDDEVVVEAGQPSHNSPVVTQQTPIDEDDLIDYSDEEDEQSQPIHDDTSRVKEVAQEESAPLDISQSDVHHGLSESPNQTVEEGIEVEQEEEAEYGQEPNHSTDQAWNHVPDADWEQDGNDEYNSHDQPDVGEDEYHEPQQEFSVYGDNKGVDELVQLANTTEKDQDLQVEQLTEAEQEDQDNESLHLHPVTINYDGSEFWLYKPDESEGDDDWLLADRSSQKKLLNQLFQECRLALGNDIGNETELGFRFDHFHNMEIFEDSTACLFIRLDHLIGTYLELHTQDGTTNPESFYITLQFRPRVSTLLGEIEKAVRDGIGYSGLSTAIATGQTAFNISYSNEHTDEAHNEDWNQEEKAEQQGEATEHNEDYEDAGDDEISPQENEQTGQPSDNYSPGSDANQPDVPPAGEQVDVVAKDDHQAQGGQAATATPSHTGQTPASRYSGEDDGDIDYSDDEDEDPTTIAQAEQASIHDPSPGSSTVQGDDVVHKDVNVEDPTNLTEPHEHDEHSYSEGLRDDQTGQDSHLDLDTDYANYEENATVEHLAYDNQAFDEEYGHGYDQHVSGEALATGDFATQEADAGDTAYYYEDAGMDQPEDLNLTRATDDGSNLEASDQGVDDGTFVDIDGAFNVPGDETEANIEATHTPFQDGSHSGSQDGIENDYLNYDDEDEDGTVEQPTVATSAAAQPVATLSTGLDHEGSPQGLKRSIDEVSSGFDIGTGLSDAKRPRV